MQCPQCQHTNREGAKFCAGCGSPLAVTCASCGNQNPPGAAFCDNCGTPLTNQTPVLSSAKSATPPATAPKSPLAYTPKHLTAELRAAQASMQHYPIVSNQVLYNLNHREIERELLPYCQEQQITIIAYTPLDDGRLVRRQPLGRHPGMATLEHIATEVGKTMAQVALNWCTARANVIAIPKSDHTERVVENCQASGWRLTAEQVQSLDAAF